ncbi:MAG: 3-deoxy-D-manno-octulosonic acid transferase [Desulfobacterales bacterium]|nr:3-deoxy-D-manno-octulosonic acid transferase [Desulfobacterales bacterium]
MNLLHFTYNLLGTGAGLSLIAPLWLRHKNHPEERERLRQRLGWYPPGIRDSLGEEPRIWLHAVSVGEVGVAAAIASVLMTQAPQCRIAVSTTTRQGLAQAQARFKARVPCFYAPMDLIGPTNKALEMVRPHVLALLETELWPNLIIKARRMGTRVAVLNGRISGSSIRRYLHIRPLMRLALGHIDTFSMISREDATRIQLLGADEKRIVVHGNAKFDSPDPLAGDHPDKARAWAMELYRLTANTPVFVAGSTRDPEEPIVLEAFAQLLRQFPQAVLILAPRHITRSQQVEQYIRQKGLTCQRRSQLDGARNGRTCPVVLLDTIGELNVTYSVASLVFCGGSLVPKGGQNLLEPAVWAKPVMYGPSMEDFADARRLIENAGGGRTVHDAHQMAAIAAEWLRRPERARADGQSARQAIMSHRGAAQRHAAVITGLLSAAGF